LAVNKAIAMISSLVTVVVVKSVNVVLLLFAVPVETPRPLVLIEFPDVGIAVPDATFQNLTLNVLSAESISNV
jgi:hypothetical protein